MKDIEDITKALAAKYSGLSIKEDKQEEPKPEPVRRSSQSNSDFFGASDRAEYKRSTQQSGPRLFPSERMAIRSWKSAGSIPNRAPVQMSQYTNEEMDAMLATQAKRGWDFQVWLEVAGLPTDLHESHDCPVYQHAAKAFLKRKDEAHRR